MGERPDKAGRNAEGIRTMRASLTVEAAFCVPVVFLAIYLFLQMFLFLRVQADMQSAMTSVVREVAEYGTVYSKLSSMTAEESEDWLAKLGIDKAIGRVGSQAFLGYLLRGFPSSETAFKSARFRWCNGWKRAAFTDGTAR